MAEPTKIEFPPIDPTKNVMDLVTARFQHLQDLLTALEERIDKTFTLRDTVRASEYSCLERDFIQINRDIDQVREEIKTRVEYAKEKAFQEKERLDAIRVIDGNNLSAAVERAQAEAKTLAKAVEQAAENRRTALADLADRIDERVNRVETFQNELRGRQGLSTPLVAVLAAFIGAFIGFALQLVFSTISHLKG